MTWPWKQRRDLEEIEARVAALEEMVPRLLTLMEMQGAATEKHHELLALESEIQAIRGQLPVDRGDQPYHW